MAKIAAKAGMAARGGMVKIAVAVNATRCKFLIALSKWSKMKLKKPSINVATSWGFFIFLRELFALFFIIIFSSLIAILFFERDK